MSERLLPLAGRAGRPVEDSDVVAVHHPLVFVEPGVDDPGFVAICQQLPESGHAAILRVESNVVRGDGRPRVPGDGIR